MNRMTTRIALTSALMLAGFAANAAPGDEDGRKHMRPSFEELDANGDGQVTMEEMEAFGQARGQEHFTSVDTNGDGNLSKEELMAQGNARAERHADRMIKRLDANEDGLLSQAELEEGARKGRGGDRMEKMFEHADADADGMISEEEFDAMKGKHGKRGKHGKHGNKGKRGEAAPSDDS